MIAEVQALMLRLSLHQRILVFVSGILLAAFLAFGYVAWTAINSSVADKLAERRATALIVARHLDDLIAHAHKHLAIAAGDLAAGELEPARVSQIVEQSLHQLQYFTYMLAFDRQSRLITTVPDAPAGDLDDEATTTISRAIDSASPQISNLVRLPIEGSYGVLFVAPIVRDGGVLGVLAAEMPIPHPAISGIASALELGRTGHMEVIDEKGWVLASTFPESLVDVTEHPDYYVPLVRTGQSKVDRALHYGAPQPESFSGDPWHVMAFVPLTSASWGVGLGQTETETFAATVDLRNRALGVAAFALVLALCCIWIGTQSVVRPIRALTKAGERMATGDLSQPIGVVQPDEVGRLGQVLETMRCRLQQSVGEITAWNRQLEQRVGERTQELEIRNRHLKALMAVATTASRRVEGEELLGKAIEELASALQVRAAWIYLWDAKEQHLRLASYWRLPADGRIALAAVTRADAPCFAASFPEASAAPHNSRMPCPYLAEHLGPSMAGMACWCAPLLMGAEPLGTLCVAIPEERHLAPDELDLVHGIAHQLAVAFENARLSVERARLEAQRHLALLRAELLATVSHELRTPMGFIKGYTTTLLRDDVTWDASQQNEFLRIIDEECDRLTELVESLLDAARSQAGRLDLQLQPLRIEPVLSRSIDRLAGVLANHQVRLDVKASPTVAADEARLEQVVVNLLQNAAKYSPRGGTIDVQLDVVGDEARLAVLDEGLGVPAAEVTRIFEPFYRVSNAVHAGIGGAGLGLAVCRAVVEAHGGRIWAELRGDRGMAVHFTLPCCAIVRGERLNGQEVRAGHRR